MAPLNWDSSNWATFGLGVLGIAASSTFDNQTRAHFYSQQSDHNWASRAGNAWGNKFLVGGLAVGTTAIAHYADNDELATTGENVIESLILSMTTTTVLKEGFGRIRPSETDQNDKWFGHGKSFPSGHVTAAFAASTAWAESVSNPSWARRGLAYSLASLSAYARMHDNKHWLSDTVAGAGIGIATASFVVKRHIADKNAAQIAMLPRPGGGAIAAQWKF